jgi:release factor glutamine methyltransferase
MSPRAQCVCRDRPFERDKGDVYRRGDGTHPQGTSTAHTSFVTAIPTSVPFNARNAETALVDAGIPVVRLLDEPTGRGNSFLLVRRGDSEAAERVLDGTAWRYRAGHRGWHRFARQALFAWDGGVSVCVSSGIPAAPLPARALARLEERVWRRARPLHGGAHEPHPVDALLVTAVQVVRPGFARPTWRKALTRLAEQQPDLAEEMAAAREAGVAASLARARRAADLPPAAENPRATLPEAVWAAGRLLQRAAGSRRVTALLDGQPSPGQAVFRTRFAGIEVDSGSRVFLPVAFSEALVEAGRERIAAKRGAVAVDVGAGCGAVSLALAAKRPDAQVHGIDISARALSWARRNAHRLGISNVSFHRGSLLEPLPRRLNGRVDVVITNVPYASWNDMPRTIEGEDPDGLGLPRKLAVAARELLSRDGWLVAQIAMEQADAFRSALRGFGYGDDRVVVARAGDVVVVARPK